MRRAISILCTLLLIALLALFCSIRAQLPGDTSALVQEKYDAWSGVLRLWIFEGWNANATGWINRAAASFETMHAGVYIQARKVDAQALRAFSSGDINPPDMILFPPGLLDSSDGLRDLGALPALRDGLAACADGYAVPVLMGAYACAQASAPQSSAHLCPPADGYSNAPAALMLMRTGEGEQAQTPQPGIDLGLPASAQKDAQAVVFTSDACAAFSRGEAGSLTVTQAQASRLRALFESGQGVSWTAVATGKAMLADQLLLLGVVDWPRADAEARAELCRAFAMHLLDARTQAELVSTGALPVIEGAAIYAGRTPYDALEAAASLPLIAPPAFGSAWRAEIAAICDAYFSGAITADEGLSRLLEALGG